MKYIRNYVQYLYIYIYIHTYIYICMFTYIYIYIYRERDREKESERACSYQQKGSCPTTCSYSTTCSHSVTPHERSTSSAPNIVALHLQIGLTHSINSN